MKQEIRKSNLHSGKNIFKNPIEYGLVNSLFKKGILKKGISTETDIYSALGVYYYNKGNYKKSKLYALRTMEKGGTIDALLLLGIMYDFGYQVEADSIEAEEYYQKIIELLKDKTEDYRYIMCEQNLNKLKLRTGQTNSQDFSSFFKNNSKDKYLNMINENLQSGASVLTVENMRDLTADRLECLSDDTIILLKYTEDPVSFQYQFYTCKDIKKIIKVSNKLLENINLNENQEDVFMQIYIKLAYYIRYDWLNNVGNSRFSVGSNNMSLLRRTGVCAGYARVLKSMLDIAGIECKALISLPSRKGHMYNKVKINGKWYFCDLTWDADNIKMFGLVKNCLRARKSFQKSKYHKNSFPNSLEDEATADWPNIQALFRKNYVKVFEGQIKGIEKKITSGIVPAKLKEESNSDLER